jgi:hypothetical protein
MTTTDRQKRLTALREAIRTDPIDAERLWYRVVALIDILSEWQVEPSPPPDPPAGQASEPRMDTHDWHELLNYVITTWEDFEKCDAVGHITGQYVGEKDGKSLRAEQPWFTLAKWWVKVNLKPEAPQPPSEPSPETKAPPPSGKPADETVDLDSFNGHTGPWSFGDDDTEVCADDGHLIFNLWTEHEPDRQLALAAPQLLAELKAARAELAQYRADARDTWRACLEAVGLDFSDLERAERECDSYGPKPSDTIRAKFASATRRAEEAEARLAAEKLARNLDAERLNHELVEERAKWPTYEKTFAKWKAK